ncbi:Crp/Fnr family transcriptional regulator [Sphingomonas glacialis]|uniref:Crp/Fnr family transcriptional regulator n=1 Tax=Sphingomonas glacialis TaxID=658225 RepID=A0A502G3S0_9SPHN|nr:Crp/Fnr family transcriptional regulator [Sphingomonas glacialis]TPG56180.1 Crp/Fnr family transcriptional regulator [Sphingomonas glacialis]
MTDTLQRLLVKLKRRSRFDSADEAALLGLPFTVKMLEPGHYLVRQGERADFTCVLLEGFAYRQKIVGDGGRQIIALQVPGDAVDLQNSLLKIADHSVQALTAITMARIPRVDLLDIAARYPAIAHAFWLDTLVDGSIAWEWIANIGRRDALMRLAHLLCECAVRLEVVNDESGDCDTLPMTQEQIGDALGLTPVHVNRMLKLLERDELIARRARTIVILDAAQLRSVADFQSAYLHLNLLND